MDWIPCSERLPDTLGGISDPVLCCCKHGGMYTATYNNCDEWYEEAYGNRLKDIIAWMPLPDPYKP